MNIKILVNTKDQLKVQVDNLTVVEILRNYLNQDSGVKFAAWKREHPSKPPILNVRTQGKTAKKALQDAIFKIDKDTSKIVTEFKKAK